MTVLEVLKKVYRKYEGDTSYPDFEDDDFQLYFDHLKDSLEEWVGMFSNHRESFAELVDAVDGTKVTAAGVSSYNAPTNFIAPANFIFVGTTRYEYEPPQKMKILQDLDSTKNWFSVIGYPGAYKVVISPTPTAVGTISYPYWRTLVAPTVEGGVIEISRPFYCVFYILHHLYLDDPNNKDLAGLYKEKMDEEERRERFALARTPAGTSNRTSDMGFMRFGTGFGHKSSGADE